MMGTYSEIRRTAILAGMLVSAVGDNLAAMALDLHAVDTGSSVFLAWLLIGQSAPGILLGLIGGAIADRCLRWWVWPASLLAQAALFAVMAVASSSFLLVVCVTSVAVIAALTGPVATKLLAHYSEDSSRSGSHLAAVMGLSQAVGVTLGGFGFTVVGVRALLAVDAVTFSLYAALACVSSTREAIIVDTTNASRQRNLFLGAERLAGPSAFGIRGLVLIVATMTGTSIEGVVGIFVLTGHAHLSTAAVGVAVASWGVGVMVGATGGGRGRALEGRARHTMAMAGAAVAMGVVFCGVASILPSAPGAVGLLFLGGVANGVFNARLSAVILSSVPETEQGRVWAAFRWIAGICILVGYLMGGALGGRHALLGMLVSGALPGGVGLIAFVVHAARCPSAKSRR